MPTICIDCRYVADRPSGIGEVVQALAKHIPPMASDLDFLFLRNASLTRPLSEAANVTEVMVASPANGPATMWWLPRLVDLHGINLFHATFNILPAGLKMATVTTLHDIMWLTDPSLCRSGLYGFVEQAFYAHGIRRALRRSDIISTVSAATHAAIRAIDPSAAERTHVTRSGVSNRFHPMTVDRARLRDLGLADERRFILTVGQNAPYKNHAGALKAFALASQDHPDLDLVLVQRRGNGARRLLEQASRLGVRQRVHLLGPQDDRDLRLLYNAAVALLHPSFCEGFGNPVAEAMASGCPVITSNTSAMPEVAAGAALLVDPHDPSLIADALRSVVTNPDLCEQLREAGLHRASQLTWKKFAEQNLALYRKLLDRSL